MRFPHVLIATALIGCACRRAPQGDAPKAEYDKTTGLLTRFEFDATKNGRNDGVSYMDGSRIVRIELDLTENGKVDRLDFYRPDRSLEKVGLSSQDDGVMDGATFYNADGTMQRIELSTKRDGRFDKTEYYERNILVRSEEDQNGDSRADKWETYGPVANPGPGEPADAIESTAFDDSGSGRPERRFVWGAGGAVARVELDPDGDGVFLVVKPSQGVSRK